MISFDKRMKTAEAAPQRIRAKVRAIGERVAIRAD